MGEPEVFNISAVVEGYNLDKVVDWLDVKR